MNQIQLSAGTARKLTRQALEQWGIRTEAWSSLGRDSGLCNDPRALATAHRCGRSPAQVLLRWAVQLGIIPIPRTSTPQHLIENMRAFDFALDTDDMARLAELDLGEGPHATRMIPRMITEHAPLSTRAGGR